MMIKHEEDQRKNTCNTMLYVTSIKNKLQKLQQHTIQANDDFVKARTPYYRSYCKQGASTGNIKSHMMLRPCTRRGEKKRTARRLTEI